MDLQLKGKGVLVTGANRGIGREIAVQFAREGANVAICARDAEQLAKAEDELRGYGGKVRAMQADLLDAAECRRVVEEAATAFGRLDVLVNNASVNARGTLMGADDDTLMQRVYVKTLGAMRCSRAAIPHLVKSGAGRIVCIGGSTAREPGNIPAGLANSALANFVKHLSDEVAQYRILVNIIHPSFCRTDRYPERLAARAKQLNCSLEEAEASFAREFPIGRIVEPSDIAPLVLFFASPHASAITGQAIGIDGGACRAVAY
jgi:3-oxoacyl-[acyl-carrier protein] reductase